jgi:hypothetical protein
MLDHSLKSLLPALCTMVRLPYRHFNTPADFFGEPVCVRQGESHATLPLATVASLKSFPAGEAVHHNPQWFFRPSFFVYGFPRELPHNL